MEQLQTKTQLLDIMRATRAEWETLMAEVGEARMSEPGVEGVWAVRDIIAHLTAYERWTAVKTLADVRGAEPTHLELLGRTDAPPADLEEDAYNAWVTEYQRQRPLRDVLAENQRSYQHLLEAIEQLSEPELKDPNRFTWLRGKSLWQILPNQSYNHYAMHMPAIRAWLHQREASPA
jgi:hypothetical protein